MYRCKLSNCHVNVGMYVCMYNLILISIVLHRMAQIGRYEGLDSEYDILHRGRDIDSGQVII